MHRDKEQNSSANKSHVRLATHTLLTPRAVPHNTTVETSIVLIDRGRECYGLVTTASCRRPLAGFEEIRFPQCPARVISDSFSYSASGVQSLRASPMGTLSAALAVRMMSRSTCVSMRGLKGASMKRINFLVGVTLAVGVVLGLLGSRM